MDKLDSDSSETYEMVELFASEGKTVEGIERKVMTQSDEDIAWEGQYECHLRNCGCGSGRKARGLWATKRVLGGVATR